MDNADETTQDAADETQDDKGSTQTPDKNASDDADAIALARKRQAGAEAARQQAEKQLKDALAKVADYESKTQTTDQQELASVARLQAKLEEAEKRAADAEAKADARILDAKYPNARKELPEVIDEIRLAKFEAMLREDEPVENERPIGNNPSRTQGGAKDKGGLDPNSLDGIRARLAAEFNKAAGF
jgi:HEPN domain-containing protein